MREKPQVKPEAPAHVVFEAILAGASAEDVRPAVRRLPPEEFRTLMCTFCLMHREVAGVCADRADEIGALLDANCQHYAGGQRTCTPGDRGGWFPILK